MPGLADAESQLAVPALALGQLVGVLVVESETPVAFDDADEHRLRVVATMLASAIEIERSRARADTDDRARRPRCRSPRRRTTPGHPGAVLRGRRQHLPRRRLPHQGRGRPHPLVAAPAHAADGRAEFTNSEVRLDPSLELPEFRDNFESRLILLKRRLDEREAPIRIEKTGRGRFRLVVEGVLALSSAGEQPS